MTLYLSVTAIINGITSLFLSIYALANNFKRPVNRSFSLFAFCVAFWSFSYFFWQISNDAEEAILLIRVFMFGSIMIPASFCHFIFCLVQLQNEKKHFIFLLYFISILLLISNLTPYFVNTVEKKMYFEYWPVPGPFFHLFVLFFHGSLIYSILQVLKKYKSLTKKVRNQVKYVIFGSVLGFIGGTTNHLLWYNIKIPPYGNILVAAYVLTSAYAIIKYKLLDIKIALARWSIFTVVHLLIFAIPILIFVLEKSVLNNIIEQNLWIGICIAGGILGFFAQFVYNYLSDKAERKIFKVQNEYHSYLRQASEDMLHVRDMKRLENRVVNVLTYDIRINYVNLFLYNEQKKIYEIASSSKRNFEFQFYKSIDSKHSLVQLLKKTMESISYDSLNNIKKENVDNIAEVREAMKSLEASIIIPIFIRRRLHGFIALSSRKNDNFYTADDINVLYTLVNQFALALDNAALYEKLENKIEERSNELNVALTNIHEDLSMAQMLQQSILPGNFNISKALHLQVKYFPQGKVGGDLYDVTTIREDYFRIFLADATGHGVQAALITMLIKSEYDKLKKHSKNPSELLETMNHKFTMEYGALLVFFTCIIVDIDTKKNKILYSSAGHPDQILIQDKEILLLNKTGRIIGVVENTKYGLKQLDFKKDDKILLFTDGILEEVNDRNEDFGMPRMTEIIKKKVKKSSKEIIDSLIKSVYEFSSVKNNINTSDDITMIGIQNIHP